MKLGEFISQFSQNNTIRLWHKLETGGGHELVVKDGHGFDDSVTMDWAVLKRKGVNRHYIDNEVLGVVSILVRQGSHTEAINIVVERLENQPFIVEANDEKKEHQESLKS